MAVWYDLMPMPYSVRPKAEGYTCENMSSHAALLCTDFEYAEV